MHPFQRNSTLTGPSRFIIEFLYFGIKEAPSCLFVAYLLGLSIP